VGFLALLVNGAYGLVRYWASVLRLIIEVPREDVVRKPIFATLNPPLLCTCPTQQAPIQEIGYLRLKVRNLIDVQVTCRNRQKTLKGLRLRVSADWNATDISQ
jgi:hypothetical protein